MDVSIVMLRSRSQSPFNRENQHYLLKCVSDSNYSTVKQSVCKLINEEENLVRFQYQNKKEFAVIVR